MGDFIKNSSKNGARWGTRTPGVCIQAYKACAVAAEPIWHKVVATEAFESSYLVFQTSPLPHMLSSVIEKF